MGSVPAFPGDNPSSWAGAKYVLKYSYQMVHSLARHGRFDYLTESFRLSQYDALQSHPNLEVKIKHMHKIPLFG